MQRWSKRTKTCGLNVNGRVFSFRSKTHGLRLHPIEAQLSYNGAVIHSITEIDGALIDEAGLNAVNIPSCWTLFGQELTFRDGLTVQIPSIPLFWAKFDCDECSGQLSFLGNDYIDGFYKDAPCEDLNQMLPRFFQLLWVTSLFGWAAG